MDTKVCNRCGNEKPVSEFHKKGTGYQWVCKDCRKAYHRQHYLANKEKYIAGARKYKDAVRSNLNEIKSSLTCAACGEDEPCCLDFHHKDADVKEIAIATAVNWGWSKERLQLELDKCIVLCSNCHRKFHAGITQLVG